MRMTIIPIDSRVTIDGISIGDLDLSWIPENVHAVQWYDTYGEVELVTRDPNIDIIELGIYEQAIPLWETKKIELDLIELERLEKNRLAEEETQRQLLLFLQNQAISQETSLDPLTPPV